MKDMKSTIVKMMLLAVLCAVAGKSWAEEATYSITKGEITGGTVKIYGGDDAPNISAGEISSAEKNTTVYLVTETDYTHSCIGITWRVERSGPSSTAESRTRTAGYSAAIKVDYVEGRVYKFTMPEDGSNVLVSAVFPEKKTEEVTYIDPTKPLAEREQKALAYILDGTETYFGSANEYTWFVCKTPATDNDGAGLTYDKYLTTYGFTRFILADGSKMTVGTAASPAGGFALNCFSGTLDIYGQTDGSGTLSTYGNNTGIHCIGQSLTFNGGTVIANGNNGGIYSGAAPITINGGTIKSVVSTGFGIYSSQGNIIINGGKVWATGEHDGIGSSDGIITLGWSHPDDYIYANGYESGAGNAMIAAGQRFVVCDPELSTDNDAFDPGDTKHNANFYFGDAHSTSATPLSGDINPTDAGAEKTIAGKTLRPIAVAETDAQGATTVSPGFLLSVAASGITPASGKTADFTIGTTPYYIYKAGTTGGTIPLSVPNYGQQGAAFNEVDYFSNTNSLIDAAVTVSGDAATAALPWTGAQDVNIRRARYYCTGVKYQEWQDAEHPNVDRNTDDDVALGTKVYILTGNENINLPGGWYVVKNWNTDESVNSGIDAFYTAPVLFKGDTHLILADNARMDVGTATTPSTGNGIYADEGSLSIYAQSTGPDMGTINTFLNNGYTGIASSSIDVDNSLTINGGNISCTTNNLYGICATSSHGASTLSINGGNISCTVNGNHGIYVYSTSGVATMYINGGNISCSGSGDSGIAAFSTDNNANLLIKGGYISINDVNIKNGIRIYSDDNNTSVTINGGCVNLNVSNYGILSTGGFFSSNTSSLSILGGTFIDNSTNGIRVKPSNGVGNLTLGWKNAGDYIYAKEYYVKNNISIADGQYMMACTSADGTGTAFTGNFNKTDFAVNNGKYLRPAMYTISAPENVNLTVADNVGTKDPVTVGSGDAAKTYYLYSPDNTVTASLKNESFVTNYLIKNTDGDPANVNIVGVGSASGVEGVNAFAFTMTDQDLKIVNNGLRLPTTGGKYLAFVDNNANVTTDITRTTILVFLGLQKNTTTGAIEARFTEVSEVPKDLPVIFAKADGVSNLPATIGVDEDNSASANALAAEIRAAASPLFMTGTAGQTVADVLRAALTDAAGNPLLDSNNLPLSLDAADYVIFLFDADKFVPVAASASSKLTGRRYILAIDKVTLLKLLNGSGSPSPARAASSTGRVWTFPVMVGGNSNGITNLTIDTDSPDNGNWYSIDGRRLNTAPRTKGVYIHKDKVVVVKY